MHRPSSDHLLVLGSVSLMDMCIYVALSVLTVALSRMGTKLLLQGRKPNAHLQLYERKLTVAWQV
ncbi:hypothetical protein BDR03DRAFT_961608 [Suillus americanus]|nr:hypothetical protein BDR03DRAFT_961608 [Suillus americanus]